MMMKMSCSCVRCGFRLCGRCMERCDATVMYLSDGEIGCRMPDLRWRRPESVADGLNHHRLPFGAARRREVPVATRHDVSTAPYTSTG